MVQNTRKHGQLRRMVFLVMLFSGCQQATDSACPPESPGMVNVDGCPMCPLIALYSEQTDNTVLTGTVDVVALVWPDGTVLWSADSLHGGPPYFRGNMGPRSVGALLSKLQKGISPVFEQFEMSVHLDPYARQAIGLCLGGQWICKHSDHMLAESRGNVVVTERATVFLLEDEQPDKWVAEFSEPYRAFRKDWAFVWHEILQSLPDPNSSDLAVGITAHVVLE
jgi:hypothetical protein